MKVISAITSRLCLACFLALLYPGGQALSAETASFNSEKPGYSLNYPSTWTFGEAPHGSAFLLRNGKDGEGEETLALRLHPLPEANNLEPAEFVFQFLHEVEDSDGPEGYFANHPLNQTFEELELVNYGETSLGGQSAAYTFCTGRKRQGGLKRCLLQVFTFQDGNIYELTWQADSKKSWETDPVIKAVLASFKFASPKGE